MEYVVGVGVVVTLFGAIIANGQWAANRRDVLRKEMMEELKRLTAVVEKIATSVQHHHEDGAAHQHTDHLVSKQEHEALCNARVSGLKDKIDTLAASTEKGFNFLAGLIKNSK